MKASTLTHKKNFPTERVGRFQEDAFMPLASVNESTRAGGVLTGENRYPMAFFILQGLHSSNHFNYNKYILSIPFSIVRKNSMDRTTYEEQQYWEHSNIVSLLQNNDSKVELALINKFTDPLNRYVKLISQNDFNFLDNKITKKAIERTIKDIKAGSPGLDYEMNMFHAVVRWSRNMVI